MDKGILVDTSGRKRLGMTAIICSLLLHAAGGWFFLQKVQAVTIHRLARTVEVVIVTPESPVPLPPEPPLKKPVTPTRPVPVSRPASAASAKPPVSVTPAEEVKQKPGATLAPVPAPPAVTSLKDEQASLRAAGIPSGQGPATSGTTAAGRNPSKVSDGSGPVVGPRYDAAYLSNPVPHYPSLAKKLKLQGTAIIRVLVSSEGRPKSVAVEKSSGARILDDAAVDAVQHWSFVPARRGDKPISDWVDVPIVFRLN